MLVFLSLLKPVLEDCVPRVEEVKLLALGFRN